MEFGGSAGMQTGSGVAQRGPDLPMIETEALGFQAIAKDSKLRLLPSPWPSDALPSPTSSLLSVASNKGLLAAGGPGEVIIARTDAVRQAFSVAVGGDVKPFQPQLSIPINTRISQVAFSSDEEHLVISAEQGGGLAVYETGGLLQGRVQSTFELPTNGTSVRALIPNPAVDRAELFAVVLSNGQLLIANMKSRQFLGGGQGPVMKDGVSCISWSNKGKQLVAGLGSGTAHQMTPEGQVKAEIPAPPGLDGDQHVSAISWLENDLFLTVHTPSKADDDMGMPPASTYHLVTRSQSTFTFQKLEEVAGPFGMNRSPPFQFIQRLRDFPPNLQDIVIVSSTASGDVGMFTRSKEPLTKHLPADQITNNFTTTNMVDDSKRAQMPMTADMTGDTSPVGMALDLSSKSKVERPLPDMDESPTPAPALMILNNEGILCVWWVLYKDSIKTGTAYPGLAAASNQEKTQSQPASASSAATAFGSSGFDQKAGAAFGTSAAAAATLGPTTAFGSSPALGKSASPWGTSGTTQANGPPFGKPAFGTSAFSTPSAPGSNQPIFGSTSMGGTFGSSSAPTSAEAPAFGTATSLGDNKPAFGAPAALGSTQASPFGGASGAKPAFGASSGLGQRTSPWGAPAATTGTTTFGQPSKPVSVFGQPTQSTGTSGGFASFASKGGFSGAAAPGERSVLKSQTPTQSFTSAMDVGSSFGGTPKKPETPTTGSVFAPGGGFKVSSSWTNPDAGKEKTAEQKSSGDNLFGGGFGEALTEASKPAQQPQDHEEVMESDKSEKASESPRSPSPSAQVRESTTPKDTPAPSKFFSSTPATITAKDSKPATSVFGTPQKPNEAPKPTPIFGSQTPVFDQGRNGDSSPPVPPESASKPSYTAGDSSSNSSNVAKSPGDAPLPPDPAPKGDAAATEPPLPPLPPPPTRDTNAKKDLASSEFIMPKPSTKPKDVSQDTTLPSGDEGLDDEEGSGIDVAQEISPSSNASLKVTPESSFGGAEKSPLGGVFNKVSNMTSAQVPRPKLFGEVAKTSAPHFPPPKPSIETSPRSPSPVRTSIPGHLLRPESLRSVSAPGVPPKDGKFGKTTLGRSVPPRQSVVPTFASSTQDAKPQETLAEDDELSDDEDALAQAQLECAIEPSLDVPPFIAHQDYPLKTEKTGVPAEVERVYKDINAMVDTLGLNARSLEAFVQGNEAVAYQSIPRLVLESEERLPLAALEVLVKDEERKATELEVGRLSDIATKLEALHNLRKDMPSLKAKKADISRILDMKTDAQVAEALRTAPLSAEQSVQLNDLRRDFANFQTQLAKAEEAVSVLKVKLATYRATKNKNGSQDTPTVEAVERTIAKMTTMTEQKNADLDFLEGQLSKLSILASRNGSREGTPVAVSTPTRKMDRSILKSPGSGSLYLTPRDSIDGRIGATADGRYSRTPRLRDVTAEDIESYEASRTRRRKVNAALKDALLRRGRQVIQLNS